MQEEGQQARDDQIEEGDEKVEDEYQLWKKNAPLIYDLLVTHLLEWPTMTCHYKPGQEDNTDSQFSHQRFVIGTQTSGNEQNYLMLMNSRLPNPKSELGQSKEAFLAQRNSEGKRKANFNCVKIEKRVIHPGEINKARFASATSDIVATKAVDGNVYLFDLAKHPTTPASSTFCPQATLVGNQTQGFALDWKPVGAQSLLSGTDDGFVFIWDLEKQLPAETVGEDGVKGSPKVGHSQRFENNGKAVNDLKFHKVDPNFFACASEDFTLSFWDLRKGSMPFLRVVAHSNEIFSLDFAPKDEFLLLSGGADGIVKLWDMRKMTRAIHEFESHTDRVLRVEWNPVNESLFASSSEDKTVNVWDCSKIGDDVVNEDHQDGPPEMIFKHKGHRERVDDICWNPARELCLMSVDAGNVLQIWEMEESIYYDDL